ncbi:MAG: polysaccharide biosynthesis/export family protein [Fuerstiella sp.]
MTMRTIATQIDSHVPVRSHGKRLAVHLVAVFSLTVFGIGCSTITGVPVNRIPRELLYAEQKDDFKDISMLRLRQDPPEFYALAPGDVLGVYIKGVLGDEEMLPPVHYHEDSSLPPAVGYPTPVREDGTLSLPIIKPVSVEGLSLVEATEKVRQAYIGGPAPILPPDSQVSLTMIRRRTVRVLVIREESGGLADVTKRGTGHVVDLPAYENDVLHALSETGGMPGLDAENQVLIYRGMYADGVQFDQILDNVSRQNCLECQDNCFCNESPLPDPPNVTRIPLRYHPGRPPNFGQGDILLGDGDIVIIRSRDKETFYTAGLLGGGEHLLPRDKDLDVIGAIAVAGGPIGSIGTGVGGIGNQGGGNRGGGRGGGYCQPSEVILIRELPCGDQITMKIDLNRALQNPSERVLIKPNDVVMLRYSLTEEVGNVLLSLVQFNFLFSGFSGNGL